ncbi:MAG TPA: sigma-70 family RNA polymerase sigma factor [Dongiaceae bacterium]|nr:sigma-70 family RNA polymerase sigma factor [Dongiaceae bacterium]
MTSRTGRTGSDESVEDRELVRRCLEGDQDAYRELLARYEHAVFGLVRRMIADPEEARDLAQETFIRTFRNLKQFDPERKFSSWIFRIANNLCIDHYRRRKLDTVPLFRHSEGEAEETWDLPDTEADPAEEFSDRELSRRLMAAVEALPPAYRVVLILRHQEDRAYEEIADILELPLGTVKARIHRAHRLLKEKLTRQGVDWIPR